MNGYCMGCCKSDQLLHKNEYVWLIDDSATNKTLTIQICNNCANRLKKYSVSATFGKDWNEAVNNLFWQL